MPFKAKSAFSLLHIVTIQPAKIAFGKAEIMDSIQQVCFACAIVAANTNDPFFKIKRTVRVIFELEQ